MRRQRSDEEGRGGQTKAEKGQQPHEQTSVILSRMAWLDRLRDSARCMESTSAVRSTMEGRCGLAWVSGMAVGYLANKQDKKKKKDTKRQHRNPNKKIADVNACVSCSQLNYLHSPNHNGLDMQQAFCLKTSNQHQTTKQPNLDWKMRKIKGGNQRGW